MYINSKLRITLVAMLVVLLLVPANLAGNAEPLNLDFKAFQKYLILNSRNLELPPTKSIPIYTLTAEPVYNRQVIAKQKNFFEIIGHPLRSGLQHPDNLFLSQNAIGLPSNSVIGTSPSPFAVIVSMNIKDRRGRFAFSFKGSGGKIQINFTKGAGSKHRIEKIVESPTDGSVNSNVVEFGSAGRYMVEFQCDSNVYFGGVLFLDSGSTLIKPAAKQKPRIAFVGDSFSEPTISDVGISYAWQGFPQVFSWMTNTNVEAVAAGGTGYLRMLNNRVAASDRIKTEVIPRNFDVVVIALGINDLIYFKSSELSAVLTDILQTFKLKSPKTIVYVVSPFWPRGIPFAPESLMETNEMLHLACIEYKGCAYLDLWSNGGYIQGSGNAMSPNGDGNADWITGPDGTHPTIIGHRYIARLVLQKILELK